MLKRGTMRLGETEYTLYEIRLKRFYRLDIMKKGGLFHVDINSVLYFRCTKKKLRQFGDEALYSKYKETVTSLTKMSGETSRESGWYGGSFVVVEQKGHHGNRIISEYRDGDLYSELYERDGVTITMNVLDGSFKTKLLPLYEYGQL